jgi:hypothetical protein
MNMWWWGGILEKLFSGLPSASRAPQGPLLKQELEPKIGKWSCKFLKCPQLILLSFQCKVLFSFSMIVISLRISLL